jgi:ABC-type lipoprotein release transport system permease subunit
MMKSLWASVESPSTFKKINGWLTVCWFVAAIPICIFLSHSVAFLVFVSVYAVVTGHLATWQAARVEERQEAAEERER